jgi:hypothetical protein
MVLQRINIKWFPVVHVVNIVENASGKFFASIVELFDEI